LSDKTISMIVAASENGVIGKDGDMPWRLSADLRHFKRITTGHTIIMGRKTWESINRSLEAAIAATDDPHPFIVGGSEIYRLALPSVSKIYLTRVHAQVDGDTLLPEIDFGDWEKVDSESHQADEKNQYDCTFETWEIRESASGAQG